MHDQPSVIMTRTGALAELTLNRPRALNALNDEMRTLIVAALGGLPRDPDVYALALRSASDRAFCAGGDVRELVALCGEDHAKACASLAFEYAMNWRLDCFSKPTVSLIDGMTMGSGVGLVLYNTHRVAGPNFAFAMPETAIGLFPDVGAASVLSRLPAAIGRYLALTGRAINRATAYRLGLVTHCIDPDRWPQITEALADAQPIDRLVDGLHADPDPAEDDLRARTGAIAACFGRPTVADIFTALEQNAAGASDDARWCRGVRDDLEKRAPLSLHVTLRHLDECARRDLRETLIADYRLAVRFLERPDLAEGVRAVLIDKDNEPRWQHASIRDVEGDEVEAMFAPLVSGELDLPARRDMQDLR